MNSLLVIGIVLLMLYGGWSVLSREWTGSSADGSFESFEYLAPSAKVFQNIK